MNLIEHARLSNKEFLKTVFSSGDYFPGFYRYNLGPRIVRGNQLTLPGVMRAMALGGVFAKELWFKETLKYYEDIEHRDLAHSDVAIYRRMRDAYKTWMTGGRCYGLICVDIAAKEDELVPGESYFFMGSVIRYGDNVVEIGVDHYHGQTHTTVSYPTDEFHTWINTIYLGSHHDLFLPARVFGEVVFDELNGTLNVAEEHLYNCLTFNEAVVFACNADRNSHLPIRWAKDIVLSEVTQ